MTVVSEHDLTQRLDRIARTLKSVYGTPEVASPEGDRSYSPLDSLIRVILSQSTSDVNSGRAWRSLRDAFPKWGDALSAGEDAIRETIHAGGLARQKARYIFAMLQRLHEERGRLDMDDVCCMSEDDAFRWLSSFDGVGTKSIAIVLMFACGRDICPVDTHVLRFSRRLALVPPKATAERAFHVLRDAIPLGEAAHLHINLLRFGRERCRARGPECFGCPFHDECVYENK